MKIMIVEDSNSLRYVVGKMLKEFGYADYASVGSAEEAISLLAREKWDVILLDWNLPKMSGLDFLKLVRSRSEFRNVSIIMVTTIRERKNIIEALKIGLQGFVLKPVDKKNLFEKLKEISIKKELS